MNLKDSTSRFVSLWTRYQPEVRRYVGMLVPRDEDAEDVMQQTAARLWEKFDQYDSKRPFVAWAIGFAYYEIMTWRQGKSRDRLIFSETILAQLHAAIGEESSLLEIRRRALDGCLQKLGTHERELLLRRYSEHGAVTRVAEQSDASVHKLYYALEKLRTRLLACIERAMRKEGWQNG
ncbi:sigma-70 family RNA polymerase sigma factor [Bremerella sp. JC770]|uniref:sigma-70 family RNA polymerase sigma factor n=1 Tax=Bremerella sp. JC770 TaxID=3232137 RepID=UPI00345AD80D